MKRLIYYILPVKLRYIIRRLYFLPIDVYEKIAGIRPKGIPPRGRIFIGHGDYITQGIKFLNYFKELAGLKPNHVVLDAGCGIGRMAIPLTTYLNNTGSYHGFDIVKSGIDWCEKNIATTYPNFHFHHVNLYNKLYNTKSGEDGRKFVFPFENQMFDFAFYTSVFTHMMPDEVENYINETSRVLKQGGKSFMTFFIVNCTSENLMLTKPTHMNFPFNKGFYRLHSSRVDTANVAYDEEWLLQKLDEAGLRMLEIKYGQWCGRDQYFDYQDIIICEKV